MKLKSLAKIGFLTIFLFAFFSNQLVLAKDEIEVKNSSDENINEVKIFNEENIYPGWYVSKLVKVKNDSDLKVDLLVTFDLDEGEKLAEVLNLYVVRKSDNVYKLGGTGDEFTLLKAKEKELFVEKLEKDKSEEYYVVIEFDENAGNEYQQLSTQFDIKFEIEGKTVKKEDETDEEILASQDRIISDSYTDKNLILEDKNETENESGSSNNTTSDLKKLDESNKNESLSSLSKSEEKNVISREFCQNKWSSWVWFLILILYIVLVLLIGFSNDSTEESKASLFWQIILVMIAWLIWFIFDNCFNYIWFPIIETIISLVLAKIFYNFNKKKA